VTTEERDPRHPVTPSPRHPVRGGEGSQGAVRRIVFLGLPGSGKSTVGPLLAERLGWRFVDLDSLIEQRAGRSVTEIFAGEGEGAFRRWEAICTDELAGSERLVLAPGGGWITTPGILARLGSGTLSVWLQVGVDGVLERLASATAQRPLLQVPDPRATVLRLLHERERWYSEAALHVSTDGRSPDQIADEIESQLRVRSGVPGGSDT
jgi:shikimate kinase